MLSFPTEVHLQNLKIQFFNLNSNKLNIIKDSDSRELNQALGPSEYRPHVSTVP